MINKTGVQHLVNRTRVIVAGIIFALVAQVVHTLGTFPTMEFYVDPAYFNVWSKIMMPTTGPPPMSFFYYAIAFNVVTGILLASVYSIICEGIPRTGVKRGLFYGIILFLAAGIPSSLSMYLLINLPVALIAWWSLESLAIYLIGGVVIAWLIK